MICHKVKPRLHWCCLILVCKYEIEINEIKYQHQILHWNKKCLLIFVSYCLWS